MIELIVNSVFVVYFSVVVFVVKFSVLHPVFKLFLSGIVKNLSQRISKINNPYFFSLGWSDDVLMS